MGSNLKKIAATCLILAGGKGRRLTPDKPLLQIDDQPIIERTARAVVPLFEAALSSPTRRKSMNFSVCLSFATSVRAVAP